MNVTFQNTTVSVKLTIAAILISSATGKLLDANAATLTIVQLFDIPPAFAAWLATAGTVKFLLAGSDYVTASVITVDGGTALV